MQQSEFINKLYPIKDKMYRFAKRLLVAHDEAEDAVQEVFSKLWNDSEKLREIKNLEAFAMTVTKNYCLDRLKSKQASHLSLIHSNYRETTGFEKQMEIRESVGMVFEMIQMLPQQQQMIIQLRDVEGYEFEEIAAIMNMNPTAVRVALSRARKTIKQALLKKQNYGLTKG